MNESKVACPHCQAAVRVDASMGGKQVACPLCHNAFLVPALSEIPNPVSPIAVNNESAAYHFACPSCEGAFQVVASALGRMVVCPACESQVRLPAPDSLGLRGAVSPPEPENTPAETLPFVAEIEEESTTNTTLVRETTNQAPIPAVDVLLPPKFPGQLPQVELVYGGALPKGVILREPTKKVNIGGQQHQLRLVSDTEKTRRRRIRNAIMFAVGIGLLLAVARMLMYS